MRPRRAVAALLLVWVPGAARADDSVDADGSVTLHHGLGVGAAAEYRRISGSLDVPVYDGGVLVSGGLEGRAYSFDLEGQVTYGRTDEGLKVVGVDGFAVMAGRAGGFRAGFVARLGFLSISRATAGDPMVSFGPGFGIMAGWDFGPWWGAGPFFHTRMMLDDHGTAVWGPSLVGGYRF